MFLLQYVGLCVFLFAFICLVLHIPMPPKVVRKEHPLDSTEYAQDLGWRVLCHLLLVGVLCVNLPLADLYADAATYRLPIPSHRAPMPAYTCRELRRLVEQSWYRLC